MHLFTVKKQFFLLFWNLTMKLIWFVRFQNDTLCIKKDTHILRVCIFTLFCDTHCIKTHSHSIWVYRRSYVNRYRLKLEFSRANGGVRWVSPPPPLTHIGGVPLPSPLLIRIINYLRIKAWLTPRAFVEIMKYHYIYWAKVSKWYNSYYTECKNFPKDSVRIFKFTRFHNISQFTIT